MMLGVVFAQIVTAAHACTFAASTPHLPTAVVQAADAAMPVDCTAMQEHGAAVSSVCESHCAYGQQIDVHPDGPVAGIAPHPALTVHSLLSFVPASIDASFLYAKSAAPPVSILFSRFLI